MNVSSQPHAPVALLLAKGSRYRIDKILDGPKTGMDVCEVEKNLRPCRESKPDPKSLSRLQTLLL